jgi:hypothetical protein
MEDSDEQNNRAAGKVHQPGHSKESRPDRKSEPHGGTPERERQGERFIVGGKMDHLQDNAAKDGHRANWRCRRSRVSTHILTPSGDDSAQIVQAVQRPFVILRWQGLTPRHFPHRGFAFGNPMHEVLAILPCNCRHLGRLR